MSYRARATSPAKRLTRCRVEIRLRRSRVARTSHIVDHGWPFAVDHEAVSRCEAPRAIRYRRVTSRQRRRARTPRLRSLADRVALGTSSACRSPGAAGGRYAIHSLERWRPGWLWSTGWACTPERTAHSGEPPAARAAPDRVASAAAVAQPRAEEPRRRTRRPPEQPGSPGATVDARVLVITADGTDPAAAAAQAALKRLGTPFDVHDATHGQRLTADQLAAGTHGRYNAILLDRGALLTGAGASAFTDAEWQALATYEASFGVRRAALYTLPDAGYGFAPTTRPPPARSPRTARPTARRFSSGRTARTRSRSRTRSSTRPPRPTRRRSRCWSTTRATRWRRRAEMPTGARRWRSRSRRPTAPPTRCS